MEAKEKKQLILLVVLFILFVIVVFSRMNSFNTKAKKPKSRKKAVQKIVKKSNKKNQAYFDRLRELSAELTLSRDPFFEVPIVLVEGPYLSGIAYGNGKMTAIIDQQVLEVGDYYKDDEIVDIKKDRVVLRNAQGNYEMLLQTVIELQNELNKKKVSEGAVNKNEDIPESEKDAEPQSEQDNEVNEEEKKELDEEDQQPSTEQLLKEQLKSVQ